MAAKALMIQGTGSNVGKSVLSAGLCRVFLQDGYRVAPFKAQNMALNSFATREGGEMGRAQVVQAQACRLDPDVRMNPILLKPTTDVGAQVVFLGKPVGNMTVEEYIDYKRKIFPQVLNVFSELAEQYDIVVLEGAGSPAEVNLKEHDIVNMRMACAAEAEVILTGDIDKGGVFASLIGTMALLEAHERERVKGFVINKFRGRVELLRPGVDFLTHKTGKETLGVVPFMESLALPQEDSVDFKSAGGRYAGTSNGGQITIAILDLPHISNFTDFDPFYLEPDVEVNVIRPGQPLGLPDAVIIPGSKNVISDLKALLLEGRGEQLLDFAREGGTVVGICGGYQMLGVTIMDPYHIESSSEKAHGLNLLPITTNLAREKTLKQVEGVHIPSGLQVRGYEIHHGETQHNDFSAALSVQDMCANPITLFSIKPLDNSSCPVSESLRKPFTDGCISADGNIWGTYIHGVFDEDAFRRWFIDGLRVRKGLTPLCAIQARYDLEDQFNRLASVLRRHLRLDKIYAMLGL